MPPSCDVVLTAVMAERQDGAVAIVACGSAFSQHRPEGDGVNRGITAWMGSGRAVAKASTAAAALPRPWLRMRTDETGDNAPEAGICFAVVHL
jgi:hypothetical protein